MSLEDLPVLRAGTTIKFKECKDRRAEVRYQREDATDAAVVNLVGYVPGILPKDNYMDKFGKISHMKNWDDQRRLLLIREVKIHHDSRGKDIWDDAMCAEIPLQQILGYKELK